MARNKTKLRFPRTKRFGIADCIALNSDLNAQTVRTLVRNQIAEGYLWVVGTSDTSGRGRPPLILARA